MWRGCANGWYTIGLNEESSARSLRLELLISLCHLTSFCFFVPFIFVSANCLEIFETANCLEMLHIWSVFLIDSRSKALLALSKSCKLDWENGYRGGVVKHCQTGSVLIWLKFSPNWPLITNRFYLQTIYIKRKENQHISSDWRVSAVFSTPRRGLRKAGVSSGCWRRRRRDRDRRSSCACHYKLSVESGVDSIVTTDNIMVSRRRPTPARPHLLRCY